MKNVENEEQITNPRVNTTFIFDLWMNNNCKSEGFGMQRSKDNMLSVLAKSTTIFVQSLGIFAQSSELWAQSIEKLIQSLDVF